jgi:hypothetical protein
MKTYAPSETNLFAVAKPMPLFPPVITAIFPYYSSFTDFIIKISTYFRTKRFNLNMRNYLVGGE